ncbi:N-acetyltransferase [Fusobacterium sp.]|uniref:GNAT family N-acetyltransferase n=1 Tax=Fusobacterium sp. TaxID=68766 RepID=UPI002903FB68|nr:N-acetyltransferase [Fusobacterium sp.]MDU1911557.1 N-acetyltransferase [Fusobacterium sp.]
MKLEIRLEEKNDYRKVEEIIREAFWNLYVPGASEHFILHSLRNSEVAVPELNFIAVKDGEIVGQIFYTKAEIKDKDGKKHEILNFGPLCVTPKYHNLGIGKALIEHSRKVAAEMGYKGIAIYGYPGYYTRVGFQSGAKFGIARADGAFPKALLVMELYPDSLKGISGNLHEFLSDLQFDGEEFLKYESSFPPKEKKYKPSQDLFAEMVNKMEDPENIKIY